MIKVILKDVLESLMMEMNDNEKKKNIKYRTR